MMKTTTTEKGDASQNRVTITSFGALRVGDTFRRKVGGVWKKLDDYTAISGASIKRMVSKNEEVKARASASRLRLRYFNVAATTVDGRTISTQLWTDDTEMANKTLESWITQKEELFHGHVALATIHDTLTGRSHHFKRWGDKLIEMDGEVRV